MRKITLLFLFGFFCSVFSYAQESKPFVLASVSMIADMTEAIGGDMIEVKSIVPIGSDPHTYDPVPSDVRLVMKADLILKNGLTFEGWIADLIGNSETKSPAVNVTQGIDTLKSEAYENAPDPHAWMSAKNGLIYAKNIHQNLIQLLPELKDQLDFNYLAYKNELEQLNEYIHEQIALIPKKQRILVTSHDAFQYYGQEYGIRLASVLGTSTEVQAQTSDITDLAKIIESSNVPAIFVESTINPKMIQQIAKTHKVKIGGKLFADSLGKKGTKAGTYIGMLKENTDIIVRALILPKAEVDEDSEEFADSSSYPYLIVAGLFLAIFIFIFIKRR